MIKMYSVVHYYNVSSLQNLQLYSPNISFRALLCL
jgi:hypothetical protein